VRGASDEIVVNEASVPGILRVIQEDFMEYLPQVDASCYDATAFHPLRITSITEQLRLVSQHGCRNLLEIGIGKGIIRSFLKSFSGVKHTCIDIAPDLNPDFVGSVLKMPFRDAQFDCILCCQVLEHLRFEDFPAALAEIHRVSSDLVILSLPDRRRLLGLRFCFFRGQWRRIEFNLESVKARKQGLISEHHWEIGHASATSGRNVARIIRASGFKIATQYRLDSFSWHCFFVLRRVPALGVGAV
jgi:SAM-dependent methyltransferase